jgi:hypothetical protein
LSDSDSDGGVESVVLEGIANIGLIARLQSFNSRDQFTKSSDQECKSMNIKVPLPFVSLLVVVTQNSPHSMQT